jgi:2-methoxy-6-polyprenyl-1,4-benzoquinol methylase
MIKTINFALRKNYKKAAFKVSPSISTYKINKFSTDSNSQKEADYTSFGFKTVKKEERQSMVNTVFANVAAKYDVMNDAMSLGVHRVWKNEFVNSLGAMKPNIIYDAQGNSKQEKMKVIDVAGGTGDISFRIWNKARDYAREYYSIMPVEIKVIDINGNMLAVGKDRAKDLQIPEEDIQFIESNAETLSFLPDNSVDIYTIAYGIRNCTNLDKVLREAHRVLKKGGRFMCLEFSHVQVPVLAQIYDFYSFNIIPQLGGIIANDKESYQYLVESIRKFPDQETFKFIIKNAGFDAVNYVNLTGGICAIHSGIKL